MEEPKGKTQQETNPPKSDRIGNDFHEGPNPNPGGTIDTSDAFAALLRSALYNGTPLRRQAEEMAFSAKQPELGPKWGLDD